MNDSLGDRMKSYEKESSHDLGGDLPIIIRIDGRSFSKFCKRFSKPYDCFLHLALNNVLLHLCKSIPDVCFAERHSDEISLLVLSKNEKKNVFFGGNIQKMSSVAASMATASFCQNLLLQGKCLTIGDDDWPCFDARCFNIPHADAPNYFVWRNKDATRNSVNMNAGMFLKHVERKDKTCDDMIGIMKNDFSFDWDALPDEKKAGYTAIKIMKTHINHNPMSVLNDRMYYERGEWVLSPSPSDCIKIRTMVEKLM